MSEELFKPELVNQEIYLDPNEEIMSKTDGEGVIEFVNEYFVKISGFKEYELLGKTMHCTQHPDMPTIIFKLMWEHLLAKQNFNVLVKNLTKDGKFYWAISDFAFKEDDQGNTVAIYNRRKTPTRKAISVFENLYKKLKNIEEESGFNYSEKYLIGFEEEKGKTIEELLIDFQSNLEPRTPISSPIQEITPPKMEAVNIPNDEQIVDLTDTFQKKETDDSINKKNNSSTKESTPNIDQDNLSIKERLARIRKIHEDTIQAIDKSSGTNLKDIGTSESITKNEEITKDTPIHKDISSKKKKGIFQKLFGKSEEELEEEKRRKEDN